MESKNSCQTDSMPTFVTGFALQNYLSAEDGLLEAAKHGYNHWYIDASLDTDSFSHWDPKRIDNLLLMMEKYSIKPLYHGNFKVPLSSDINDLRLTAIQYAKNEIDISAKLSCPLILHGGAIVEPRLVSQAKKKALNNYLETLKELSEYAAKKNVVLLLENLSNYKNYCPFHYIFTNDDEYDFILSKIDLPLFLDVGHSNICHGDPVETIKKFSSRIAGMSFSNNNGKTDQHLALNEGTVDFHEICQTIILENWSGIVAFETRNVGSPTDNIQELNEIYHTVSSRLR